MKRTNLVICPLCKETKDAQNQSFYCCGKSWKTSKNMSELNEKLAHHGDNIISTPLLESKTQKIIPAKKGEKGLSEASFLIDGAGNKHFFDKKAEKQRIADEKLQNSNEESENNLNELNLEIEQ